MGQAEATMRHIRETYALLEDLGKMAHIADIGFRVNIGGMEVGLPMDKVAELKQKFQTLKEQIRGKVLNIQNI